MRIRFARWGVGVENLRLYVPVHNSRKTQVFAKKVTLEWLRRRLILRVSELDVFSLKWAEGTASNPVELTRRVTADDDAAPPPSKLYRVCKPLLLALGEVVLSSFLVTLLIFYSLHPTFVTHIALAILTTIDVTITDWKLHYGFSTSPQLSALLTSEKFYCLSETAVVNIRNTELYLDDRRLLADGLSQIEVKAVRTGKRFELSIDIPSEQNKFVKLSITPLLLKAVITELGLPLRSGLSADVPWSDTPPTSLTHASASFLKPLKEWVMSVITLQASLSDLWLIAILPPFLTKQQQLSRAFQSSADIRVSIGAVEGRVASEPCSMVTRSKEFCLSYSPKDGNFALLCAPRFETGLLVDEGSALVIRLSNETAHDTANRSAHAWRLTLRQGVLESRTSQACVEMAGYSQIARLVAAAAHDPLMRWLDTFSRLLIETSVWEARSSMATTPIQRMQVAVDELMFQVVGFPSVWEIQGLDLTRVFIGGVENFAVVAIKSLIQHADKPTSPSLYLRDWRLEIHRSRQLLPQSATERVKMQLQELRVSVNTQLLEVLVDVWDDVVCSELLMTPEEAVAGVDFVSADDDADSMFSAWSSPHSSARPTALITNSPSIHGWKHSPILDEHTAQAMKEMHHLLHLFSFVYLSAVRAFALDRSVRSHQMLLSFLLERTLIEADCEAHALQMQVDIFAAYPDEQVGRYAGHFKLKQLSVPMEIKPDGTTTVEISCRFARIRLFQAFSRASRVFSAVTEYRRSKQASQYVFTLEEFGRTGSMPFAPTVLISWPSWSHMLRELHASFHCHLMSVNLTEDESDRLATISGVHVDASNVRLQLSAQHFNLGWPMCLPPYLSLTLHISGIQTQAGAGTVFNVALTSLGQFSIKVENGLASVSIICREKLNVQMSEEYVLRLYNVFESHVHPLSCSPNHWKLYGLSNTRHFVHLGLCSTVCTVRFPVHRTGFKPWEITFHSSGRLLCRPPSVDLVSAMLSMNRQHAESTAGVPTLTNALSESVVSVKLVKGVGFEMPNRLAHLESVSLELGALILEGLVDQEGCCKFKLGVSQGSAGGLVHVRPNDETDVPVRASFLQSSAATIEVSKQPGRDLQLDIDISRFALLIPPLPKTLDFLVSHTMVMSIFDGQTQHLPSVQNLLQSLSLHIRNLEIVLLADADLSARHGVLSFCCLSLHHTQQPKEGITEIEGAQIYLGKNKTTNRFLQPPCLSDYRPLPFDFSKPLLVWCTPKLGEKPGYFLSPLLESAINFKLVRCANILRVELLGDDPIVKLNLLLRDLYPISCLYCDFSYTFESYRSVFSSQPDISAFDPTGELFDSPPHIYDPESQAESPKYELYVIRLKLDISLLNATGLKSITKASFTIPTLSINYEPWKQNLSANLMIEKGVWIVCYGMRPGEVLNFRHMTIKISSLSEKGEVKVSVAKALVSPLDASSLAVFKTLIEESIKQEFQVYFTERPTAGKATPTIDHLELEGKTAIQDGRICREYLFHSLEEEDEFVWLAGPSLGGSDNPAPCAFLKKQELKSWCPRFTVLLKTALPDKYVYWHHRRVKNKTDAILLVGTSRGKGKPSDAYVLDPGEAGPIQELDTLYVEIMGYQGQAQKVRLDPRFVASEPISGLMTFAKPGQRDQLIIRPYEEPLTMKADEETEEASLLTIRFEPLVKIRNALPWRIEMRFESGDAVIVKPSCTVRSTLTSLKCLEVKCRQGWLQLSGDPQLHIEVCNTQGVSCWCRVIQKKCADLQKWVCFTATASFKNSSSVPLAVYCLSEESKEELSVSGSPLAVQTHDVFRKQSLPPILLPTELYEVPSIDTPVPIRFVAEDFSALFLKELSTEQVLSSTPPELGATPEGLITLGNPLDMSMESKGALSMADLAKRRCFDVCLSPRKAVRLTWEPATKWKCVAITVCDPLCVHNRTDSGLMFLCQDRVVRIPAGNTLNLPLSLSKDMCQMSLDNDVACEFVTLGDSDRQFITTGRHSEKANVLTQFGRVVELVRSQMHFRVRRVSGRYQDDLYVENSAPAQHHRDRFAICLDTEQYIVLNNKATVPVFVSLDGKLYTQVTARGATSLWKKKPLDYTLLVAVAIDHKAVIEEDLEGSIDRGTNDCFYAPAPVILQPLTQVKLSAHGVAQTAASTEKWIRLASPGVSKNSAPRLLAFNFDTVSRLKELRAGAVDSVLMAFQVTTTRAGRILVVTFTGQRRVSTGRRRPASGEAVLRSLASDQPSPSFAEAQPTALHSLVGADSRAKSERHPWREGAVSVSAEDSLVPLLKHEPATQEGVPSEPTSDAARVVVWTVALRIAKLLVKCVSPDVAVLTLILRRFNFDLETTLWTWRHVRLRIDFARAVCLLSEDQAGLPALSIESVSPSSVPGSKVIATLGADHPIGFTAAANPSLSTSLAGSDTSTVAMFIKINAEKYLFLEDLDLLHFHDACFHLRPVCLAVDLEDIQMLSKWKDCFWLAREDSASILDSVPSAQEEWHSGPGSRNRGNDADSSVMSGNFIDRYIDSTLLRIDRLALSRVCVKINLRTNSQIETSPTLNFPPIELFNILGFKQLHQDVIRTHLVAGIAQQWHKSVLSLQIAGFSSGSIAKFGDKLLNALSRDGVSDDEILFADSGVALEDSPSTPVVNTLSQLRSLIRHLNHQSLT